MLVSRPLYTQRIRQFENTPLMEVVTGVRRSGNSTTLQLVRDELDSQGASPDRIVFINLESLEFEHLDEDVPECGPALHAPPPARCRSFS